MKPIEIFQNFAVLKEAMAGADVPQEIKLKVAQEFLSSLPPKAFSAQCPATRVWLECAVQSIIDTLQTEADGRKADKESPNQKGSPKAEANGRKQKA